MSWFSHAVGRIGHYLDPRTAAAAQAHLAERAAHYADPRTQYHALVEAAHFTARQARKDYVLSSKITAKAAKIITPLLAFVASFVPIFGLILGPILAAAGALIERLTASVSLRARGVTGLENRQRSRNEEKRVFEYGMYGSAVGALTSAATGVTLTAATASAQAASSTPAVAATGAPMVPTVDEGAEILANVKTAVSPGVYAASTSPNFAAEALPVGTALKEASTVAAGGILGTGITASQLLNTATSIVPKLVSALSPKPIGGPSGGSALAFPAGAGTGAEGTGDTGTGEGPLGAFGDTLTRLPLPVKLLGFVFGAGVTVYAFNKGRKAA